MAKTEKKHSEIELTDFKLVYEYKQAEKKAAEDKAELAFHKASFFGSTDSPPESKNLQPLELAIFKIDGRTPISYISLYTLDKTISRSKS